METLKELEGILDEAYDCDGFVRITLGLGLDVERDFGNKKFIITYPKLKMGMLRHVLIGRLCRLEDEHKDYYEGVKSGKTELVFETYSKDKFVLKAKEIAGCEPTRENQAVGPYYHQVTTR